MDSDNSFGIFKLFLPLNQEQIYKTLHRKLTIKHHERNPTKARVDLRCSGKVRRI
jgi:hypothetical protein